MRSKAGSFSSSTLVLHLPDSPSQGFNFSPSRAVYRLLTNSELVVLLYETQIHPFALVTFCVIKRKHVEYHFESGMFSVREQTDLVSLTDVTIQCIY